MPLCLTALEGVFQELAVGDAVTMGRIDLYVPSGRTSAVLSLGRDDRRQQEGRLRLRPHALGHGDLAPRVRQDPREQVCAPARHLLGLLFLFSAEDATPVAMINDGILQHIRVGGGAGLGVKYLSRPTAASSA